MRRKHGLQIKGTGFTAGFPIENKELVLPDSAIDFIGPDIDIGFRIAKASRPGRMAVSMDLSDILAQSEDLEPFAFHWVGWDVFKGVFSDRPYPIIWITTTQEPHIYP